MLKSQQPYAKEFLQKTPKSPSIIILLMNLRRELVNNKECGKGGRLLISLYRNTCPESIHVSTDNIILGERKIEHRNFQP
jgi:hypothetical protein